MFPRKEPSSVRPAGPLRSAIDEVLRRRALRKAAFRSLGTTTYDRCTSLRCTEAILCRRVVKLGEIVRNPGISYVEVKP